MHNQAGVDLYVRTVEKIKEAGGKIECGGKVFIDVFLSFIT